MVLPLILVSLWLRLKKKDILEHFTFKPSLSFLSGLSPILFSSFSLLRRFTAAVNWDQNSLAS
jgi:hypothetical protein